MKTETKAADRLRPDSRRDQTRRRADEDFMKAGPARGRRTIAMTPRILLADDDSGVRSGLGAVLSGEGYIVIPARDGQEAIQLAASGPVDLVVLDLNMPVKNGWNTFEQLTREYPLLPIVIITARANQLFTAMGAGAGALLEKPLEIPVLLGSIARLLAETEEARLARLAGHTAEFTYAQARPFPASDRR